ncbi:MULTISPECIES: hypothetical protein [Lacisediminihabitans]|uniref:Uncharacterized protein n=1 Tax=Lacisediminihabitans profunda TaxID=2594790 RepID=A0A5C8UX91_9MICO|nr:hypothetical protein [Lacisediminihabitans profunda]TXN32329.1 hypothetical protein FVP33_01540 [Lacisediminihabitans profunda]
MKATTALSPDVLDLETAELLPARETLFLDFNINVSPVIAVNLALAINAATMASTASANALQHLALVHP